MNDVIYKLKLYGPIKFGKYLFAEFKMVFYHIFFQSYSQCQEDLILATLLSNVSKGFYIDIGAYDPIRFSNTRRFYQRGWSGINVEPNLFQYARFKKFRSRDINLNIGVSNKRANMYYYKMNPTTLSTFSARKAEEYQRKGYVLEEKRIVPILPLNLIFRKYVKKKVVHFMTIDVEGFDMEVLRGNDWSVFRPVVVCLEIHFSESNSRDDKMRELMIIKFMRNHNYSYVGKTLLNYFFVDDSQIDQIHLLNHATTKRIYEK